jgi:hypothetical protein
MKNFFAIALTSLFVSAMPLQAASAAAVDVQGSAPACVTYEGSVTPSVRQKVAEQGGLIIDLTDAPLSAFVSRLSELVGAVPPYTIDRVVLVRPTEDEDGLYNIGIFSDNCLKTVLNLPGEIVRALTAPPAPGEKVSN